MLYLKNAFTIAFSPSDAESCALSYLEGADAAREAGKDDTYWMDRTRLWLDRVTILSWVSDQAPLIEGPRAGYLTSAVVLVLGIGPSSVD